MPPSIRIETLSSGARAKLGLIFSTKDRTHFSQRAVEALMGEDDLDLFWMDGSRTPEGIALPRELASTLPRLREVHYGVVGGPDAAIIYGLTHLLGQGYDYIGLLENDILLPGDWFGHTMRLFEAGERDGLKVGAVSARCLANRRLLQRHGYAISSNLGAGMIIMRADAVRAVLSRYRTVTGPEIQAAFIAATGINPLATLPEATEPWRAAADWNFDIAMLMEGYVSLAHSPSLARHLDTAFADNPMMQLQTSVDVAEVDEAAFARYRTHMARTVPGTAGGSLGALPLFDRQTQCWTAFPHEIACADPSFIKGRWELKWSQCLGPFAWIAQEAGCEIALPVFAEKSSIICGFGPECGAADIAMGDRYGHLDCRAADATLTMVGLEAMTTPGATLRLTVRRPGFAFYGLMASRIQAWQRGRYDFDYRTIAPLIPTP
jgi:hypothetical protein